MSALARRRYKVVRQETPAVAGWWGGDPTNSIDEMQMAQKILRHFYDHFRVKRGFSSLNEAVEKVFP